MAIKRARRRAKKLNKNSYKKITIRNLAGRLVPLALGSLKASNNSLSGSLRIKFGDYVLYSSLGNIIKVSLFYRENNKLLRLQIEKDKVNNNVYQEDFLISNQTASQLIRGFKSELRKHLLTEG